MTNETQTRRIHPADTALFRQVVSRLDNWSVAEREEEAEAAIASVISFILANRQGFEALDRAFKTIGKDA